MKTATVKTAYVKTIPGRLRTLEDLLAGQATVERYTTRAQWLAARLKGVGSSDLPIILGYSSWRSPLQLWAEKVGRIGPEEDMQSEAAEFGVALEPIVKRKYRERTNRRLLDLPSLTIIRSIQHPWMIASMDDVVIPGQESNGHSGPAPFEAKTAAAWKREEWADEPPLIYQAQVSWQLAVSGWTWGSIGLVLGGQKFQHADVERNDRFIDGAMELADRFWSSVQAEREPYAEPEDRDVLRMLYPRPAGGKTISLPPASIEWAKTIEDGRKRAKAVKLELDHAENLMRQAFGDAEEGMLPDGSGVWTLKLTKRAGYVVKETEFRQLRKKGTGDE